MMRIKSRVEKLEQALGGDQSKTVSGVALFIVDPKQMESLGYECEGVHVMRNAGEPEEQLRRRAMDAVDWTTNKQKTFDPIFAE